VTNVGGARARRLDPDRLLIVVAPHPDDEVIGFGGALRDHVAAGGRALVVALTDGGAFDNRASPSERRASERRRRDEQVAALATLGLPARQIVRGGFPDGELAAWSTELRTFLRELVADVSMGESALVVSPWRHDGHPDHEATATAVLTLVGVESWEVPIWSWHTGTAHRWTDFVLPISPAARRAKRAALRCHVSQLATLPAGRPAILSRRFLDDFDRPVEVVVR
jgi:LmbE family N-acetylglucosaminyl deacetylase